MGQYKVTNSEIEEINQISHYGEIAELLILKCNPNDI